MNYSPLVDRIAGEGAAAWDLHSQAVAAQRRGEDVIVLSVGDPDLATPQAVVDRGIEALQAGDTHYTELIGRHHLRAAIAERFARQGVAVGPGNVCAVAGAQNSLFFASMLLLGAGDEAIMLEPGYVTYEATIAASGARAVAVALPEAGGFRPDSAAIAAAITPRTRALFITNPNNPTGVVMSADELAAIAEIAHEHDLWVVSDEVYGELTFDTAHTSIAALPGMAERTVTVASLSKSHAMTGWRAGWLIGLETLVQHAGRLALAVLYGLPGFVQEAAATALAQADKITADMRAVYRRRRELVVERLSAIAGLRVVPPEAGLFVMLDVRATGLDGPEFAWRLLREQGVSVLDAAAFGASAAGYVRLSYVVDDQQLAEACRRIEAFCRSLG